MESSLASYYIPALIKEKRVAAVPAKFYVGDVCMAELKFIRKYYSGNYLGVFLPTGVHLDSAQKYERHKKIVLKEDPFTCSLQHFFEKHLNLATVPETTEGFRLEVDGRPLEVNWSEPWEKPVGSLEAKLKVMCQGRKELVIPMAKALAAKDYFIDTSWRYNKRAPKIHLEMNGTRTPSMAVCQDGKIFDYRERKYVADSLEDWMRKAFGLPDTEEVTWEQLETAVCVNGFPIWTHLYNLTTVRGLKDIYLLEFCLKVESAYDLDRFIQKLRSLCQTEFKAALRHPLAQIEIFGYDPESQELHSMTVSRRYIRFDNDERKGLSAEEAEKILRTYPCIWYMRFKSKYAVCDEKPHRFDYH